MGFDRFVMLPWFELHFANSSSECQTIVHPGLQVTVQWEGIYEGDIWCLVGRGQDGWFACCFDTMDMLSLYLGIRIIANSNDSGSLKTTSLRLGLVSGKEPAFHGCVDLTRPRQGPVHYRWSLRWHPHLAERGGEIYFVRSTWQYRISKREIQGTLSTDLSEPIWLTTLRTEIPKSKPRQSSHHPQTFIPVSWEMPAQTGSLGRKWL